MSKKNDLAPIDDYLRREDPALPKTVRFSPRLWERLDELAEIKEAESLNSLLVAIAERACDEGGV